ncbi:MAG: L-seryl-tRNA(Sec) selenium transferase [Planctomycetota bacterium]|nr:L-seryl-tRNA(Sec) selenium transferase [Planctomycetota bacterium]
MKLPATQSESMSSNPYRALPAVDDLLARALELDQFAQESKKLLVAEIRGDLDDARDAIRDQALDGEAVTNFYVWERFLKRLIKRVKERHQRIYVGAINATGVVLHTGLGRAILPKEAQEAILDASGFTILEVDRLSGQRNRREDGIATLLKELTGAPAATVVNNNAAATMICLSALAKGKEVIVARGQLVEIGGSFRIPDILEESGAKLVEVGTTNKVHLRDYENAITENTGLILRVHTSNYRVVGFTSEVPVADLVTLGNKHDVLVMDDLGSGALFDLSPYGLPHEPLIQDSLATGAHVICFSGDKLLGGPQAGLIIGLEEPVTLIRKHPLYRAMRPDKLILAALEGSLQIYRRPEHVRELIPVIRMLTACKEGLGKRAQAFHNTLGELDAEIEVIEEGSKVGGGAYAVESLPTYCVAINPKDMSAGDLGEKMRRYTTPIFVRIKENRVLLDMRTIQPEQEETVAESLRSILKA